MSEAAKRPGWKQVLRNLGQPKIAVMLLLGLASGLPFMLVGNTMGYWLRDVGIELATIGFASWVGLAYSFKFLWAPIVDKVDAPLLGRWLGRRRGWMAFAQIVVGVALLGMSIVRPEGGLGVFVALALVAAFASATQDIVVDAWRIESSEKSDELALLSSAYQLGYRAALLVTDALILIVAAKVGWVASYQLMAAAMVLGLVATLWAREPLRSVQLAKAFDPDAIAARPISDVMVVRGVLTFVAACLGLYHAAVFIGAALGRVQAGVPTNEPLDWPRLIWALLGLVVGWMLWPKQQSEVVQQPATWTRPLLLPLLRFYDAVVNPFLVFFRTHGRFAALMLLAISLYRLPDFFMGPMANPFYSDLGITKETVGAVRGSVGLVASVVGIAVAGLFAIRFGYVATLLAGAILGPGSNIAFAWLAYQGADPSAFATAMIIDNFATGFAGTALVAYMSSLTNIGYTATQYALLSSFYALPGKFLKGLSGATVETLSAGTTLIDGYARFFMLTALFGIPVLLLCIVLVRRKPPAVSVAHDG